ncbi:MAG: hypothetical protein LC130_24490 [Bryobacterales bacterium]|nr:hypothetical protein [Bryobacterales bacterium]
MQKLIGRAKDMQIVIVSDREPVSRREYMASMSTEFVVTPVLNEVQVRCSHTNPPGGDPEERVAVIFTTVRETTAALRRAQVLDAAGASIRIIVPSLRTPAMRVRTRRYRFRAVHGRLSRVKDGVSVIAKTAGQNRVLVAHTGEIPSPQ